MKPPAPERWDGFDCLNYCAPTFQHPSCPGPCVVACCQGQDEHLSGCNKGAPS
jgi:hypothetical protein